MDQAMNPVISRSEATRNSWWSFIKNVAATFSLFPWLLLLSQEYFPKSRGKGSGGQAAICVVIVLGPTMYVYFSHITAKSVLYIGLRNNKKKRINNNISCSGKNYLLSILLVLVNIIFPVPLRISSTINTVSYKKKKKKHDIATSVAMMSTHIYWYYYCSVVLGVCFSRYCTPMQYHYTFYQNS